MAEIKIAFWNLQNLFDTTVSEIAADLEFTPDKGWGQAAFDAKVKNLASVINLMHDGQGPDLLGICEVENHEVAEKLMDKCSRQDYELAHVEAPDIRGIDTSLIFSKNVFELLDEPLGHIVHLRYPTRDIFEVNLGVRQNNSKLAVLVNHWPSRWKGLHETEPYRITVASHCGQIVDRILKYPRNEYLDMSDTQNTLEKLNTRWNRNVIVMGDFNDEPFNRSLLDELKASSGEDKLEEPIKKSEDRNTPSPESYLKKQAYLFNCMCRFLGLPDEGTHYYSQSTNTMNILDQFIISRGLYYGLQGLKMKLDSIEVFKPEIMTTSGKGRPKAFDRETNKGFSDHFPIQGAIQTLVT